MYTIVVSCQWRYIFLSTLSLSPKLGEEIKWAPKRSTMMELPSKRENPISTQGKKGAWKFSRPKKFILTLGFRLLQMYTSMMVKAWPRNTRLTKVPNIWKHVKNLTHSADGADALKGEQPRDLQLHFHVNTRDSQIPKCFMLRNCSVAGKKHCQNLHI